MKINLGMLSNRDKITINEEVVFNKEYLENSKIKDLKNVKANGYVYQNDMDEYKIYLDVTGTMYIEDSVTLDIIPYDFSFNIDDIIEENLINEQNMLDIIELLWQNIVLEVPIRFTNSDAENLKGENWKVIDEFTKKDEIDPRMQKLYDYYKGGE